MEMWVRALMCERSVDLALAAECKQPGLEPGRKLRLNLGHGDSPEQKQAEAQVTAEGVRGGGRGGGDG